MTDEKQEKKQPIDMTTEELLDYTIAPEIAERLREIARGEDDGEPELEASEDVDC
jgi:hypothetical protein